MTIADGRVVALDQPAPEGALVVNCRGGVLLPGFVDPHVHLAAMAAAACSVDCSSRSVRSIAAIQERIAIAARAAGGDGWLRGVGYDESALEESRHPTRWDLDVAVPDRPVRLLHRSGHAAVLNSRALALAGITIASEEPPGGVIERRLDDGEPTGLLIDLDAVIDRVVPPLPFDSLVEGMRRVSDALLAAGVVAVQDLTQRNDAAQLAFLDRVCAAARFWPARLTAATRPGVPGNGPVKLMLAEAGGIDAAQRRHLAAVVEEAHRAGRQVAVHAVTAEAVEAALDAIEAALRREPRAGHRHRIEHASLCPSALAARAAALGAVIVSNPAFLVESGERYLRTVPAANLPHLYPVGAIARTGATVAAASDAPVAPSAPLAGVQAALTRRSAAGTRLPGEAADLQTAVAAVTSTAAYAAFAEDKYGVITPGRRADLVLLTGELRDERPAVWWTLLSGEAGFVADDAPGFPVRAPVHRGR